MTTRDVVILSRYTVTNKKRKVKLFYMCTYIQLKRDIHTLDF